MIKLEKEVKVGLGKKISEVDNIKDLKNGFVTIYFDGAFENVLKSKVKVAKEVKEETKENNYKELQKKAKELKINPIQTKEVLIEKINEKLKEEKEDIVVDKEKELLIKKAIEQGFEINDTSKLSIEEIKELIGE